jgi:hypothetical protein
VQRAALIQPLCDEHEPRPLIELWDDGLHGLLDRPRQRLRAPDDQRRRTAEERRRHQVPDRRLQLRGLVVAPDHADTIPEPGAEPRERTLDEERIVAVQEVVWTERRALDRRERIGRRAGGRPPRGAQKPSMLCT